MTTKSNIFKKQQMTPRQAILMGAFALEQFAQQHGSGESAELNQAAMLLTQLAETMPAPRTVEVLPVRRIRQAGKRGVRVRYEVVNGQ